MNDFIISTDSTADLPDKFLKEHNVLIHPLCYHIDNIEYGFDQELDPKEFYSKMRSGILPTTDASTPDFILNQYKEQLEKGYDILHISFSSGLSSSYNNAVICAAQMMEKYPDKVIRVIDTLAASMGQGLLVYYAVQMKEAGKSLEEVCTWLEEYKLHLCHQFTVDDLFHLHRGGRVSKTAAIVGTLINVKPLLHVDNSGHLIPLNNVRGRRKALTALVDKMEASVGSYQNEIIFISHGDCLPDAEFVAGLVRERFSINNIWINYVSPTIGAHSGPGTVALFYLGAKR